MSQFKPTNEQLAAYKDGQLEVVNDKEDYIYRGEIEKAELVVAPGIILFKGFETDPSVEVRVKLRWMAKMDQNTGEWWSNPELNYIASLEIYSVRITSEGRLYMDCPITGEHATFFPPDGSKLDPAKVKGLVLA